MTNYEIAQKEIVKALRAIDKAAELIADMPEYTDSKSIFHAQAVSQYNHLITAAHNLNDAQK